MLLVLLPFGVAALFLYRLAMSTPTRLSVAYLEAAVAGAAVPLTGGATSPLLPYLLAPGLAIGLLKGPRTVVQGGVLAGVWLMGLQLSLHGTDGLTHFAVTGGQWILLGIAVGLVAVWARALVAQSGERVDQYAEARSLLQQLRGVAHRLPGGLDAASAAEAILDRAAEVASSSRSAVLAQTVTGGALVPMAVRGTRRVPWRTPLTEPGPLQRAWQSQDVVVDRRRADKAGRRQGSSLAVVPLVGSDAPFGLLILESFELDAFDDSRCQSLEVAARDLALRLETALLFDEVRSVATVEERDRLAREMHDGVAQELAFIGYQLDDLRLQANKVDAVLGSRVSEVRTDVTGLISNLRLSITDLKTSVSPDRGLGSALSSYIRAVGSGKLAVHLSLQESPFRLPGEREVVLLQLAQAVAQDVRRSGRAKNLWVTLHVDPPSARLVVEHDGALKASALDLDDVRTELNRLDGQLEVGSRRGGGVRVEATFRGEAE